MKEKVEKNTTKENDKDSLIRKKLINAILIVSSIIVVLLVIITVLLFKGDNSNVADEVVNENGIINGVISDFGDKQSNENNTIINQGNNHKVTTYGIDVSKYQGEIDWKKVASDNVKFAIIRVGYRTDKSGEIKKDPYAEYNLYNASKAGIQVGVYFFSTAINEEEAKEEAVWVCDLIKDYPITYPVVYNLEGFNSQDSRMNGVTQEERTKNAEIFLDIIRSEGYNPMFYASKNELINDECWDVELLSSKYDIWLAQYISTEYSDSIKPDYTGTYSMWQYTSQGKVAGIDGDVDKNIAYFGYTDTKESKSGKELQEVTINKEDTNTEDTKPNDTDITEDENGYKYEIVDEIVTAKIETNLRDYPSTDSNSKVITTIKNGDNVTRIAVGTNNGWSKVEYNGEILYAVTTYLTTDVD